jgi:phosphoserine phosphatase RsbX
VDDVTAAGVSYGVAVRTMAGQPAPGDVAMVRPFPDGVLVVAIDGLGHGREASDVATRAVRLLEGHAAESVLHLVKRCHEGLAGTRGVVMSLASFNTVDHTMTWLGIGNVEGILIRAEPAARPAYEFLVMRGGLVGQHLPPLMASIIPLSKGDTLVFCTDGIAGGFWKTLNAAEEPQKLADRILGFYAKPTDDALVVVARYEDIER